MLATDTTAPMTTLLNKVPSHHMPDSDAEQDGEDDADGPLRGGRPSAPVTNHSKKFHPMQNIRRMTPISAKQFETMDVRKWEGPASKGLIKIPPKTYPRING